MAYPVQPVGWTIQTFGSTCAGRTAALAHCDARALADGQRGFGLFAPASVKTKAYRFPRDVCQAGSR